MEATPFSVWFKQNIGWIKTVAILLLIGFLILAFTNIGCTRTERDKFIQQTTILHLQNDSLSAQNTILKQSLVVSDSDKVKYEDRIVIINHSSDSLKKVIRKIRNNLDSVSYFISKEKTNDVYKFLTQGVYPDTGRAIYPFTEKQIRLIDETYLKKASLENITALLDKDMNNLLAVIQTKDSLITSYKQSSFNLLIQNVNLAEVIENKDKEIVLYQKQEKRYNRNGIIWKVSTGVATVVAFIFAFK
jgi:hypothetical protein